MEPGHARRCARRAWPPGDDRDAELGSGAARGAGRRANRPVSVSEEARSPSASEAGSKQMARESSLLSVGGLRDLPGGTAGALRRDPRPEQAVAHPRDDRRLVRAETGLHHDPRRLHHRCGADVPPASRQDAGRLRGRKALAGLLRGILPTLRERKPREAPFEDWIPVAVAREPNQAMVSSPRRRCHRCEPGHRRHLPAFRPSRACSPRRSDLQPSTLRRVATAPGNRDAARSPRDRRPPHRALRWKALGRERDSRADGRCTRRGQCDSRGAISPRRRGRRGW